MLDIYLKLRLQVASDLTRMPVSKYFYDQFLSSNNKELALDYGNFNKIRSANTLCKAKSDLLSLNRFSNDNWKELTELQGHYYKIINNKHFNGYIQYLSYNPFILHLYTEYQIKILRTFKKRVIVHLDATGSLLRKINPEKGFLLCFDRWSSRLFD